MTAFFRRLATTNDGRVVFGQSPNGPAILATLASIVSAVTSGSVQLWSARLATLLWIYWSGLEIFTGVNLFRRALGGVVLVAVILGYARLSVSQ